MGLFRRGERAEISMSLIVNKLYHSYKKTQRCRASRAEKSEVDPNIVDELPTQSGSFT